MTIQEIRKKMARLWCKIQKEKEILYRHVDQWNALAEQQDRRHGFRYIRNKNGTVVEIYDSRNKVEIRDEAAEK